MLRRGLEITSTVCSFGGGAGGGGGGVAWSGATVTAFCWCVVSCGDSVAVLIVCSGVGWCRVIWCGVVGRIAGLDPWCSHVIVDSDCSLPVNPDCVLVVSRWYSPCSSPVCIAASKTAAIFSSTGHGRSSGFVMRCLVAAGVAAIGCLR